jgi:hypothetical protein
LHKPLTGVFVQTILDISHKESSRGTKPACDESHQRAGAGESSAYLMSAGKSHPLACRMKETGRDAGKLSQVEIKNPGR